MRAEYKEVLDDLDKMKSSFETLIAKYDEFLALPETAVAPSSLIDTLKFARKVCADELERVKKERVKYKEAIDEIARLEVQLNIC